MTKPKFMANPVKTADTVNSKLADDVTNNKRNTQNLKKNLEQKATITPKKRPARGRLLCLFPHRTAMVGQCCFFIAAQTKTCDENDTYYIFLLKCMILHSKLLLTGLFKRGSISDTVGK